MRYVHKVLNCRCSLPLKLYDGHMKTRYGLVDSLDPVAFHSVLTVLLLGNLYIPGFIADNTSSQLGVFTPCLAI